MAVIGPFDFVGGYSPGYDFTTLPQGKGYATIMENMKIKAGYACPRWKWYTINTAMGSSGNNVTNITSWNDTVNSKLTLVLTFIDTGPTGKLFVVDATGWNPMVGLLTFLDKTGTITSASLSGSTVYDSLNNILVGTGNSANSGAPFKVTAYNANGAALGGSPPSADIAKQVNNFMFLARNLSSTTTQSRVYWSNVNDPETWTGTNVLDFSKNDGEPIMAVGSIGTDVYIFKQTSIGRLSTVTLTVSGAVTLGPLTQVIKGKGCCGPRALDNLPNGNIVFIGFDGHFYEFDGSTLVDRSREPYPGHNVYDNGPFASGHNAFGLTSLLQGTDTTVKVLRGINEVWIGYPQSMRSLNQQAVCFNFEQNAWHGEGPNQIYAATTIPIAPVSASLPTYYNDLESTEILVTGSVSARVDATQFNVPYPWNHGGATSFSIGTTIELPDTADGPFIPRSMWFETNYTASSGATLASFFVYADFDTAVPTTQVYSATASTVLPTRIVIPINFKQDAVGSNIFPKTISLLFTGTGQGTISIGGSYQSEILRIGKIWLSDEIIR